MHFEIANSTLRLGYGNKKFTGLWWISQVLSWKTYEVLTPSELEYDPDPQKKQELDASVPQQCREELIQASLMSFQGGDCH